MRPAAHIPPVRSAVSWRSWLIFVLTIGVLVSATYVFVVYIMNVPPNLYPKLDAAENARAALGTRIETVAARTPEPEVLRQLQADLALAEKELIGLRPAVDTAQAEIERLKRRITESKPSEGVDDLRDQASGLERDVADLRRRLARFDGLKAQVTSFDDRITELEGRLAYVDLPAKTTLSEHVATVARRQGGGGGDAGPAIARLRQDMNSGLKEVEQDIRQLGNHMAAVPSGTIVAWHTSRGVPSGWAECDGRKGTPDLRNRFLYGASRASAVGRTGGGTGHSSVDTHWHHADTWTGQTHANMEAVIYVQGAAHPGHNVYAFFARGGHDVNTSLPPYTTVHFIMKL